MDLSTNQFFPEPAQTENEKDALLASEEKEASAHDQDVRVVIRIRPPLQHELEGYLGVPFESTTKVSGKNKYISLLDPANGEDRPFQHGFTFDHIYDTSSSQQEVYDSTARSLVSSCLEGYNATILAYGQTGTGKTYTMEGDKDRFQSRGIVPRAIEQIFSYIQENASVTNRFLVRASYLQIYNDVICDLLKPENQNLQIREDDKSKENNRGVYVDGLSEWVVRTPQEILKLMASGSSLRATGKTKLNEVSSRSHAILKLIIEQCETTFIDDSGRPMSPEDFETMLYENERNGGSSLSKTKNVRQKFRIAKLNLVDLAGSERVRISGATGQRLEESKKINRSLSALGNVISALTDSKKTRSHIPYRDSKLTRILEDSLGGNCKTAMIAMVSPAFDAFSETLSTLKFANRAKSIRNNAFVNEDVDQNSLLRKYEKELKRLKKELAKRSQNVVDQRVIIELEDQKRRAEADKMAALMALESRSFEFMREKQEKRKLEERIEELESQVLIGGELQDTPQFRKAINEHRDRIRLEYRERMDDLEKEREQIEAQKAQVDRYKQLLLKQRDIMVALTQRLNERDDQIVALQDEIDVGEREQSQTQELLDRKTAQLIHVQRINMELEQKVTELLQQRKENQSENLSREANGGHQSIQTNQPGVSATVTGSDSVQLGLEARVRALTTQYQTFRDEMTDRLAKKDSQIRNLKEENAKLQLDVQHSHEESTRQKTDSELVEEVERLRQRSLNHAKEQVAMRTIMEKVNVLVLSVLTESQEAGQPPHPQLRALSSLSAAAVNALSQMDN